MTESSSDAKYRSHTNKERKVECPYCGEEKKSRGLYQHVWRSGDEAHGGHKNVPDDWEDRDPEVVGEVDVTLHVPTHKEFDHELLLCKWCGEKFKGGHGLSVHLSRTEDSNHPTDEKVETSGLRIPAGPNDEAILEEDMLEDVEEHNLDASVFSDLDVLDTGREGGDSGPPEPPEGYVPIPDLIEFIAWLESRDHEEPADELRSVIEPYQ